ncbi:MAG: YvcK family protein [Bacillota bacterium]|nr:YvcK family protein [Bacillota bacterium]
MINSWAERIRIAVKWLYPGLGVKRWLLLTMAGLLLFMGSLILLWTHGSYESKVLLYLELFKGFSLPLFMIILLVLSGLIIFFWGLQRTGNAIASVLLPHHGRRLIESLYTRHYLEKGPKIITVGGGTGSSVLLRGLKEYTSNITAVVTVTDDGGSSGRLRGEMGILPPGDLRNCLLALADTEPLMEELFQHRFHGGEGLGGHNFGNLLIVAMTEMMGFDRAIREFSKVLAIRGTVLPVTLEQVTLQAQFCDGTWEKGETRIVKHRKPISHLSLSPSSCTVVPEVLSAIKKADAIILGPGSLYTSVLPNLLVPGVKEAIKESTAPCFYVCNIMTQPGETEGFSTSQHLEVFREHGCLDLIDAVIVNTDTGISQELAQKYQLEGAETVEIDRSLLSRWNVGIIEAPLLERGEPARHNSRKLATLIMDKIIERETGLDGFWAYTFVSLNGNFHRTKKEISHSRYNPFSSNYKKLRRAFYNAFARDKY